MEEENQVSGKGPEAFEDTKNLESEDFTFYNQNKEEARSNIDSSAKDLTDFIELLIKDVPAPSEEEIEKGKEKILEKIYSDPVRNEKKTETKKKVTLKVLFLAAVLSALSVSGLFALGNSRNIGIENGFATFAKDTVRVVLFGEGEEEYIDIDTLLLDLENHGFEDIYLPEDFIVNSCDYKVSIPEYTYDGLEQVSFSIIKDATEIDFILNNYQTLNKTSVKSSEKAKTILINNIPMTIYKQNNYSIIQFEIESYNYNIVSRTPYNEIISLCETIKLVENMK